MNHFGSRFFCTIVSLFLISCENEAFLINLDDAPLQSQVASTTSFQFKTYQVPPTLGGLHSIYAGRNEQFDASRTLLEFESHTILNWANFEIDSGYFQLTLDSTFSGNIPEVSTITMGYFRRDSNYVELGSNYTNVDWISEDYPRLSSKFSSDTTGLMHLRFPIDSALVKTLGDTAEGSWLYLLELPEESDFMLKFYSSDSPIHGPILRTFMHKATDDSDTSATVVDSTRVFNGQSDVTLFIPPNLENSLFDSNYSYIGVAAGLVTVVKADLASMNIPKKASVGRAKLILTMDEAHSSAGALDSLFIQAYAMEDTITNWSWGEELNEDIYDHHTASIAKSSSAAPIGSILKLDVTDLLQSLISEREVEDKTMVNLGFKLKMINSGSVFDYAAIRSDSSALGQPLLEIYYEIP